MTTFTVNDDNNIAAFASVEEVAQAGDSTAISFESQASLADLSTQWPLSRFVDIWNSIPGQTPVKKFTDRKTSVARIWKAIQPLAGNGQPSDPTAAATPTAQQTKEEGGQIEASEAAAELPKHEVQPSKVAAPELREAPETLEELKITAKRANVVTKASPTKKAGAKAARNLEAAKESGDEAGRTNKKAEVIAMMKREGGATLSEIMAATKWQKHTVRGFVSILGKKGGLAIESTKNAGGARSYRIAK